MRRTAALLALVLATSGWGVLQSTDGDVESGNHAYGTGKFGEALERYRAAQGRGDDPRIHYDMGAALYQQGVAAKDPTQRDALLRQAEEEFAHAADTPDAALKSSAYAALGNSSYQRQKWDDAASAYRRALRADPANQQARHNLEMVLKRKPPEPPPQQQPQQGKDDKKDQQQQQQGQQPEQGKEDKKDQQQQGKQDQKKDQQQQGQPDQKQQQQKHGQQDQQQQQKPDQDQDQDQDQAQNRQGSDEEEKMDALEQRSRDLQRNRLRQQGRRDQRGRLPSRKDW